MLLGAVDIGSNAMRFLVSTAINYGGTWQFQRVEYLRYPIRLGEDVFTKGFVSDVKIKKLINLLGAFKTMFEVFEVEAFKVCATSAMRDAKNSAEILHEIKQRIDVDIEIIAGQREASLIDKALYNHVQSGLYLHVDVGGGSTEINIIENGEKKASASYNIGTVRAIHNQIDPTQWDKMRQWIVTEIRSKRYTNPMCIGTGGNIKKLHELSGLGADTALPLVRLEQIRDSLRTLSIQERMQQLKLNQDRADVIVPAADIYINLMQWAGSERILAPNLGLIDGIIADLFYSMKH